MLDARCFMSPMYPNLLEEPWWHCNVPLVSVNTEEKTKFILKVALYLFVL